MLLPGLTINRGLHAMTLVFKQLLILISSAFLAISCGYGGKNKVETDNAKVDGNIVLTVGQVSITSYELNKNYHIFKQRFSMENHRAPSKAEAETWLNDYIAQTYFLADAAAKGYYQRKDIETIVEGMENFILTEPNGQLEKVLTAGITPSYVKSEIERSTKQIHLQFIELHDKKTADAVLGQSGYANGQPDWEGALANASKKGALNGQDIYEWPFMSFWKEEKSLFNLKKGDVRLLSLQSGFYLLYVTDITYLPQPPLTAVQMELKLKRDIVKGYLEKMQQQLRFTVNRDNLLALGIKISSGEPVYRLNKDDYPGLLTRELANYNLPGGQLEKITVNELIDYYNQLPLRAYLKNSAGIEEYLYKIASDVPVRKDAEKMGIMNDPKFILDKNNYRNNIVLQKYTEACLADTAGISPREIEQTYITLKAVLKKPAEIVYSLHAFSTEPDALYSSAKLRRFNNADSVSLKNVLLSKRHLKFSLNSATMPDTLKKMLFVLKPRQISRPVKVDNKFMFLVKEATLGTQAMDLNEAKPFIVEKIKAKRLQTIKQGKLTTLVKIYQKKDNIDHDKYYLQ